MTDRPVRCGAVSDTFPRQYARTQRLTLGEPRNVVVSADGQRVVFARSRGGDDPVNCLWVLDVATGDERLVADPLALLGVVDDEALPPEERARRERARESAGGVTAFATDEAGSVAAFALGGRLFVAGLISAAARELVVDGPVFDPRPDPPAQRVAYVSGRSLRIAELDGTSWELAGEEPEEISWGSAEFVAAEEMGRLRGYWWSPDGLAIAACRVDVSPIPTWYISDPANPEVAPRAVRYPAAGTQNADVTLHVLVLDGSSIEVTWDHDAFPYLADVRWASSSRLLLTVQSRDQRRLQVLAADPSVGTTEAIYTAEDEAWIELVPGTPAVLGERLVMVADRDGARRLLVDGDAVTPDDLQVRAVVDAGDGTVTFTANPIDDATVLDVWRWDGAGPDEGHRRRAACTAPQSAARPRCCATCRSAHRARRPDSSTGRRSPRSPRPHWSRRTSRCSPPPNAGWPPPCSSPTTTTVRRCRCCSTRTAGRTRCASSPRTTRSSRRSGSPTRASPWWWSTGAAHPAVGRRGSAPCTSTSPPRCSTTRSTRCTPSPPTTRSTSAGWPSAGGASAATSPRSPCCADPDVFHAAIAGAPVTEWRLYDTHYTERYLGDPSVDDHAYAASSLLPLAGDLTRPLLLIHGLADDNVVAAHTLQLSSALLAEGKPHEVLPLVGVTHMTPQEVVAENLLLHQLAFLRRSLGPQA